MTGMDIVREGDLTAVGFDDCIIGVADIVSGDQVVRKVVYSADQMLKQLTSEFIEGAVPEIEAEEMAQEYLEFNTFSAYIGPQTPLFVWGVL